MIFYLEKYPFQNRKSYELKSSIEGYQSDILKYLIQVSNRKAVQSS